LFIKKKPSFFKRKGMPTPDASQFTQLKKYSAINRRQPDQKTISHLYQPVPSVTQPVDFLASFTNKVVAGSKFSPMNGDRGVQAKPKVPGGNTNGQSGRGGGGGGVPNITTDSTVDNEDGTGTIYYTLSNAVGVAEMGVLVSDLDNVSYPDAHATNIRNIPPTAGQKSPRYTADEAEYNTTLWVRAYAVLTNGQVIQGDIVDMVITGPSA